MKWGRIRYKPAGSPPHRQTVIAACMLQRESFARWLTIPLLSARKAERVIPTLLDIQLPFPLDTCEHSLVALAPSQAGRGASALVVGARHSDIAARLKSLSLAGADPHILDQEGIALWSQAVEEFPDVGKAGTTSAILYCANSHTTLSLGQNGTFLSAHTWRNPDFDLLQRVLKAHLGHRADSFRWFLAGPSTAPERTGELLRMLSSSLGIPEIRRVDDPGSFLARALARRALCGLSTRSNVRTGQFLHPAERSRVYRQPYLSAVACLAAGLLLCGVNASWRAAAARRTAVLQRELHQLAVSITGNPRLVPPRQELFAARRFVQEQEKANAPLMAAFAPHLVHPLHAVLDISSRHNLVFESLSLNRQALVAHGWARDRGACDRTAAGLAQSGWRTSIEQKESRPGDSQQGFVLRMILPHEEN